MEDASEMSNFVFLRRAALALGMVLLTVGTPCWLSEEGAHLPLHWILLAIALPALGLDDDMVLLICAIVCSWIWSVSVTYVTGVSRGHRLITSSSDDEGSDETDSEESDDEEDETDSEESDDVDDGSEEDKSGDETAEPADDAAAGVRSIAADSDDGDVVEIGEDEDCELSEGEATPE